MKLFGLRLVAVSSRVLVSVSQSLGGTRPAYGGTLRVSSAITPTSLDPLDSRAEDSVSTRSLERLLFDTLVRVDESGRIQPGLATSWQSDDSHRRWTLALRDGVTFADGTLLIAELVAASLRTSNPGWKISVTGDSVALQFADPEWKLPAKLALSSNAIVKRSNNTVSGTGPYKIVEWQPAKKLLLAAREDYWGGRSYIDSIQIELGTSAGDRSMSIELGKSDIAEKASEAGQPSGSKGASLLSSAPVELLAVVLRRDAVSVNDAKLMDVLGLSIDRDSIKDVLLRRQGEVATGMLPQWISGYEFLFPVTFDLQRAGQLRREVKESVSWSLGYDAADPLNRLIAERIALNAKDAGISLRPSPSGEAELRLVRVCAQSVEPIVALEAMSKEIGLASLGVSDASIAAAYKAELALLQSHRVIPLIHKPFIYGVGPAIMNWHAQLDGTWDGSNLWLKPGTP